MRLGRRGRIALRWLAVLVGLASGGIAILIVYGVRLVDTAMANLGRPGTVVLARPLVLRRGQPWSSQDLGAALELRGFRRVTWPPGRGELSVEGTTVRLGPGVCLDQREEVLAETRPAGLRLLAGSSELALVQVRAPVIGTTAVSDVVHWTTPLEAVSGNLLTAVVDVEDRTFLSHAGLSLRGLLRAALRDLLAGGVRQGGSTITQQLAKILMLRPARTLPRKIAEAWLAALIDFRYSKKEILEAYLNRIYLGQDGGWQIQGVGAASHFYFGKRPSDLEIDEAAALAGLIAAPNRYDPFTHPQAALARRRVVLQAMVREGHLDGPATELLASRPLPGFPRRLRWPPAGQAVEVILGQGGLERELVSSVDVDAAAAVWTGIPAALELVESRFPQLRGLARQGDPLQVAVVVLRIDGQVLAMAGSRSGLPGEFNRAVDARRPIGSLVKPFVAALALARGWTAESPVDDSPLAVTVGSEVWEPQNSDGRFRGVITLREALVLSRNLPMVRVGLDVGVPAVAEGLRGLGLAAAKPNPAILLGALEASPLQVARAYAALLGEGRLPAPTWLLSGSLPSPAVLDPLATAGVLAMLEDVPRRGTAASLSGRVEGWLAGKTGTTDERRDSWFVGLRPDYVTVVWVGTDGNAQTGLYGATGALEVWSAIDARLPRTFRSAGRVSP
ncbi:MAG: transglycosylase domain-containing protein [Thermoanaerobaculaceae bacterium]|jgi:penicillin-binding protein 1B|nr:transglycosylase domain-containing protein [Thermoanaerobaculaceae bacterium]